MFTDPQTTSTVGAAFHDLPVELVAAVVAEVVSIGDLLRLREVNHTFSNFATPRAFTTFHVVNTSASVAGCANLLQCDHLSRLVRRLVVHCEAGPGENRLVNRGTSCRGRLYSTSSEPCSIID